MLRTTMNENILTLVTPIKAETAEKAFSRMVAKDEKGNELFAVEAGDEASISKFGLVCNSVKDGKLAVVIVLPLGTTLDDVKKQYGQAIIEANKYVDQIAEAAEAEISAIDEIFAEE